MNPIEIVRREFIYLGYYFSIQFSQIFRYWAFGILIGSVVSVFFKQPIHRLMLKMKSLRMGVLGVLPASALGILSPLCMHGTIPLVASFAGAGLREDWIAAFMMSSVLLNPQLVAYTAVLGETAVYVRIVTCFLCGAAAGLLVNAFYRKRRFFRFSAFGEAANRDTHPNPLVRLIFNIGRNIRATGPYFLAGILLSALYQRYVPQSVTTSLFGGNRQLGVFMAATLGVPMYVCGGGTIPLLNQWLIQGMSMGAATAFMLTGPATKLTNLSALKSVMDRRSFLLYLAFTMVFSFLSGTVVNVLV